ncbi:MAG: PmoA family protein [Gemmataceae bacterium]
MRRRYLLLIASLVMPPIVLAIPLPASSHSPTNNTTAEALDGKKRPRGAKVTLNIKDETVEFLVNKQVVSVYHTKGQPKPILWPVYGPKGSKVTRSYPLIKGVKGEAADHIHHRSVWFTYGDVIPKGIPIKQKIRGVDGVDFWSERTGAGKIICTKVKAGPSGPDWASIETHNEWRMADGKKIMDEDRTVIFYDFGIARLYVFIVRLQATVCDILFGDTKEGAMGVRVSHLLREDKSGGKIQNSKGKTGANACWGRRADWCDYSGQINGKPVGIAIFDDKKNQWRSCFHVRAYGLMAANPFGRSRSRFPDARNIKALADLPKGETLVLRYGVLVHDGNTKEGQVAEYYQQFLKSRKRELK